MVERMSINKTFPPYRFLRPHQKPRRKETVGKKRKDFRDEQNALFYTWWNNRNPSGVPLSREWWRAGMQDGRVRPSLGGVWISKRALHNDFSAGLDLASPGLTWERFLVLLREAHPNKTRSFELKTHTFSGLLISRWSEVFLWFPGGRVTEFHEASSHPSAPVVE